MAIQLSKGQKFGLTKINPKLDRLLIGLGWSAGQNVDLDAAAFLLGSNGKVFSDEDFIFYGNLKHKSGAVIHSGDNVAGGSGDVEQILVDLKKIPSAIEKISFTVTIYDAKNKNQNFGNVRNAYIRVVDQNSGNEVRFDLSEALTVETAIVIGELYRRNDEWKFSAIGAGFTGGLAALCKNFGVEAESESNLNVGNVQRIVLTSNQPIKQKNSLNQKNDRSINRRDQNSQIKEIVMSKYENRWLYKSDNNFADLNFEFKTDWYKFTCLYELAGGRQAAMPNKNDSGFFNRPPYIVNDSTLYSYDTLIRVNGNFMDNFKRFILIAKWSSGIYDGKPNDILKIKCAGNPDLVIKINDFISGDYILMAEIENLGDSLKVEMFNKAYSNVSKLKADFDWKNFIE